MGKRNDWHNTHRTDGDGWGLDAGDDGWGEESVTPLMDRETRRIKRAREYAIGDRVIVTRGYFRGCPAVVKGAGEATLSVTIAHVDWEGAPTYHLNENNVSEF